jgi:integrase/recombinase XerD
MAVSTRAALHTAVSGYLAHQRALGRDYTSVEWLLNNVCRFVKRVRADDLDASVFFRWCRSQQHLSANTRRKDLLILRRFCLYRRRSEPICFVPDPLYFPRRQPYVTPVLITRQQIAHMLGVARKFPPTPNSPLLPAVLNIAIVLLYTAGLRIGELTRLLLSDVDAHAGVLHIRNSKFHKARLIPLSADARRELRHYLKRRLSEPHDLRPEAPLLCHHLYSRTRGRGTYSVVGLGAAIRRLFIQANIRDAEGRRPRVHDVRHNFAQEALKRWYLEGKDVQTNLPKLALYMGHVSITSTAHYLHFIPEVAGLASKRFGQIFEHLVQGDL